MGFWIHAALFFSLLLAAWLGFVLHAHLTKVAMDDLVDDGGDIPYHLLYRTLFGKPKK